MNVIDHNVYSSSVKRISIRFLQIIATTKSKTTLLIMLAISMSISTQRNRSKLSWGTSLTMISRERWGLLGKLCMEPWPVSDHCHAHFAETLCGMDFSPTKYNKDEWVRKAQKEEWSLWVPLYPYRLLHDCEQVTLGITVWIFMIIDACHNAWSSWLDVWCSVLKQAGLLKTLCCNNELKKFNEQPFWLQCKEGMESHSSWRSSLWKVCCFEVKKEVANWKELSWSKRT